MENYVVIKELPDAHVGTDVIWDEGKNHYTYQKSSYVSPASKNYLTAGQVTQTPAFFKKASEYSEYFAWDNPVYSRKEIYDLIKTTFENSEFGTVNLNGHNFEILLTRFRNALREMGKNNAEKLLNKYR